MRFTTLTALALPLLLNAALAWAGPAGEVCIQPKAKDTEPVMSPDLDKRILTLRNGEFTVQIGSGTPMKVSDKKETCVKGLDLTQKHLVTIKSDQKPYTSFRFSFADHDANKVTLSYKPGYGTWMIQAPGGDKN